MNYTTSDIAELLDLTQYTVKKHIKKLNLENTGFFVQAERNINVLYYPESTYLQIKNKVEEDRATEATAELEEAETLHPLVTDKRCLNLNWWPDIIPDCFKECEV